MSRDSAGQSMSIHDVVVAVGVGAVGARPRQAVAGACEARPRRRSARRSRVETRAHRGRHRLHAAPLLGPVRRRSRSSASASTCRTRRSSPGRSPRLRPRAGTVPASRRPTGRRTCSPPSRTPARSRRSAPGTRPATSSRSPRTARPRPHEPTGAWLERIGLPYDELYCSFDKVGRCVELEIDVLIDDSPVNLLQGAGSGYHPRHDRAPVEPRAVRGRGHRVRAGLADAGRSARSGCSRERAARSARRPPSDPRVAAPRDRARPPGHRLGALRARRGAARRARSTSSSTTTGSAARSRGSRTCPPTGGALLVSNHAGALPPDAPMIAKAIKEEHSRPRPLHLTVEHFFKGYPGLAMLVEQARRRARAPGQRAPPAVRRAAARARLPGGPQGHREALQGPLPAAPLRPRRLRRGGDARPRADRPDRRDRRRGGDADVRPDRPAPAPDRADLLPGHAAVPALRRCSARAYLPAKFRIRFLEPIPTRPVGRAPVGRQGARADGRRGRPRADPGRADRHRRPPPLGVVRSSMRVLVTGVSTYWGGRLAQALEARPRGRDDHRRQPRRPDAASSSAPSTSASASSTRCCGGSCRPPRSTR